MNGESILKGIGAQTKADDSDQVQSEIGSKRSQSGLKQDTIDMNTSIYRDQDSTMRRVD